QVQGSTGTASEEPSTFERFAPFGDVHVRQRLHEQQATAAKFSRDRAKHANDSEVANRKFDLFFIGVKMQVAGPDIRSILDQEWNQTIWFFSRECVER